MVLGLDLALYRVVVLHHDWRLDGRTDQHVVIVGAIDKFPGGDITRDMELTIGLQDRYLYALEQRARDKKSPDDAIARPGRRLSALLDFVSLAVSSARSLFGFGSITSLALPWTS